MVFGVEVWVVRCGVSGLGRGLGSGAWFWGLVRVKGSGVWFWGLVLGSGTGVWFWPLESAAPVYRAGPWWTRGPCDW